MKILVDHKNWLLPVSQTYILGSGSERGSFLETLDRDGNRAANKLIRRVDQYECPDGQSNKKAWVADQIQRKWDARKIASATPKATAPARAVRL